MTGKRGGCACARDDVIEKRAVEKIPTGVDVYIAESFVVNKFLIVKNAFLFTD